MRFEEALTEMRKGKIVKPQYLNGTKFKIMDSILYTKRQDKNYWKEVTHINIELLFCFWEIVE